MDNIDKYQQNSHSVPDMNNNDSSNKYDSIVESRQDSGISSVIMKLRDDYDDRKKIDELIFSGKGLKNLGNTWFFNSMMQWLTATRDLFFILKENTLKQTGRGYIFNEIFRDFILEMRESKKEIISPAELFKAIIRKNSRFRGYQQQDAHELLMNLLEFLDKEAIKKKETPINEYVFGGKMMTSSNI